MRLCSAPALTRRALPACNGVTEPLTLIAIGAVGGAVAGLVMGTIMLRAHGLAQLVLSIAIVQLFHEAANKASAYTGGSDGLAGLMLSPLFGIFEFDLWGQTAYLFGLALLVIVFVVLKFVVSSPFGMLCRGIKEDPVRIRAMGAFVFPVLLKMFVISGAVAGMGGALAAISTQVVGLDSVSFELSANALVMLVLGGLGTLYGALVGTVIFMGFEHVVSSINPFHWMTMVGALLIAVVLAAPKRPQRSLDKLFAIRPRQGRPAMSELFRVEGLTKILRRACGQPQHLARHAGWGTAGPHRTERRRQDNLREPRHGADSSRVQGASS